MSATLSLREALTEGIASGTFVDTKIILFSRKNSSGRVFAPKALYANSNILKGIPHFDQVLFGNFAEAGPQEFEDTFGIDESYDYGYYSDSDLEDDDETAADAIKGALKKAVPPKGAVGEVLRKVTPQKGSLRRALTTDSLRRLRTGSFRKPPQEKYAEQPYKGKVVRIPDMAFVTFQAFLLYLYTDEIEFAPFKSGTNRNWGIGLRDSAHDEISKPSPRSVYRLADKYDVPALRDLAFSRIRAELKDCDLIKETFSKFASKYEEIRTECVTQLVAALVNDTKQTLWSRVSMIIDRHSRGDLEHVADALSLLWGKANQRGSVIASSSAQPPPPPIEHPKNWRGLKAAMIRSIKQGVFFDQKYWTTHSADGRVLKPIYFSSLITGDTLRECITHAGSQDTVAKHPTMALDPESDCEDDPTEAEEGTLSPQQDHSGEEQGRARAILVPGSFAAWRSLFYYLCTDEISFAPLKSQGADHRTASILESAPSEPPPCSPKSIFVLARSLNLQHLSDLAFKDIESKLSEDNIVEEFASRVCSTYPEVREMICRLFFSKFQNPTTVRRMQEKIAAVCATRSVHQADALKLGLQSALDIKKRDGVVGTGVMLRCQESDCPGNRSYTSYSLEGIVNNEFCQPCFKIGRERFLICAGCGNERRGRHVQCQHCTKKFVLVASFPG